MLRIGAHSFVNRLVLAPMAGVTDQPFRKLCRRLGAGLVVGEMVSCKPELRETRKSRWRTDHSDEPSPRSVQIAGGVASLMADAASYNVDIGAEIIDINMGCPAKKVCNVQAGSALLSDEQNVARILDAVVKAVDVPVTLKIRTGPSPDQRNGVRIARIAEDAGIAALSVHGRTRVCAFKGTVEHRTTRDIKRAVSIPVIANGDITGPEMARRVLDETAADGLMIGRGAQGNPWIFREIAHYLMHGEVPARPGVREVRDVLLEHLDGLHSFYGRETGVRVARKHLAWYCKARAGGERFWSRINRVEDAVAQRRLVEAFFAEEEGRDAAYTSLECAA